MSATTVILLLAAVWYVAWNLGFSTAQRWERTRHDPNPFGELPPVQPLGEEPTQYLDVDVVTRRLKPIGIATIAIRHNQPEARN